MRNTMKNFALGVALVAGLLGTGAVAANAAPQEFRGHEFAGRGFDRPVGREFVRPVGRDFGRPVVGVGFGYAAPVDTAYIPPCPGDGYLWTAGYYNGGIWIPGAWRFGGGYGRGYAYGRDFHADARFDHARGFDRGGRGRR